ncbi:MAG TPA: ABC transporter permease [Planctomycetota bacterium]|nr:ABC transporter permease [Planctomycetota bacterium]
MTLRRKAVAARAAVLVALLAAPALLPLAPPDAVDLGRRGATAGGAPDGAGPSPSRPLGVDELGRCRLSRLLSGLRVSLLCAVAGGVVCIVVGSVVGVVAGWFGGRIDAALMRTVDFADSIPAFLMVVVAQAGIRAARGPLAGGDARLVALFLILGLTTWFTCARLVRAKTLWLKSREFIVAARAVGTPAARIFTRHLLPNLASAIGVSAALAAPRIVLLEAFLSFLGLGVEAPRVSLGSLARTGLDSVHAADLRLAPVSIPCAVLAFLMILLGGFRTARVGAENRVA